MRLPVGDQDKGVVEAADDGLVPLAEADGARNLEREAQLVAAVALGLGVGAAEDVVRVDGVRVDAEHVKVDGVPLLVQQLLELLDGARRRRGRRAHVPVDANIGRQPCCRQPRRGGRVELGQALRGRAAAVRPV